MKTFLMCHPDFYDVEYEINMHMEGNIDNVNYALAQKQWHHLRDTISRHAIVMLIEPQPGLPDMVFTANAAIVNHQYDLALIASFKHPQRQGESDHFQKWFHDNDFATAEDYSVLHEGAGDCLVDRYGEYWFGYGQRSTIDAMQLVCDTMDVAFVHELQLVDPRWYHLDTCFCPLDTGYYLACRSAFSEHSWQYIMNVIGDKLITVHEDDAINFACNAVSIDDVVIMPQCSDSLVAELERFGHTVVRVDMSEFIKSGGAAKCLVLEIKN